MPETTANGPGAAVITTALARAWWPCRLCSAVEVVVASQDRSGPLQCLPGPSAVGGDEGDRLTHQAHIGIGSAAQGAKAPATDSPPIQLDDEAADLGVEWPGGRGPPRPRADGSDVRRVRRWRWPRRRPEGRPACGRSRRSCRSPSTTAGPIAGRQQHHAGWSEHEHGAARDDRRPRSTAWRPGRGRRRGRLRRGRWRVVGSRDHRLRVDRPEATQHAVGADAGNDRDADADGQGRDGRRERHHGRHRTDRSGSPDYVACVGECVDSVPAGVG